MTNSPTAGQIDMAALREVKRRFPSQHDIIHAAIEVYESARQQPQEKSPYADYTWEDVAMLVQENRILKTQQPQVSVEVMRDKVAFFIATGGWDDRKKTLHDIQHGDYAKADAVLSYLHPYLTHQSAAQVSVEEVIEKLTNCGHPKYLDNPITDSERGLIRDVLSALTHQGVKMEAGDADKHEMELLAMERDGK